MLGWQGMHRPTPYLGIFDVTSRALLASREVESLIHSDFIEKGSRFCLSMIVSESRFHY